MLGKSVCNECRGTKTLEIVKDTYTGQALIRSRCLSCGFIEDIWLFGDEPEYLEHLAEQYGIAVNDIRHALNGKTHLPTQIQETTYKQLKGLNPYLETLYQIKNIIALSDGRTIRLHHRSNKAIINIDVTYHRIPDVYQLKAYKLTNHGLNCEEIFNMNGLMFDQLDHTIHKLLHEHADTPLQYV